MGHPFSHRAQELRTLNPDQSWPLAPTGDLFRLQADGLIARVMTAEHLMAIALLTRRATDHARLVKLVEAGIADVDRLRDILARHSPLDAWAKFENRFLQL